MGQNGCFPERKTPIRLSMEGSKVSEATWDMALPKERLSEEANKMRAEGNHLLFTHLAGGNHRATWFVAYGIEGVQDWLFEQHR